MTLRKKLWITIACLSVILCTLVTGSIAWLTDKTTKITNTFTPSNIDVELVEANHGTDYKFKMIPGKTYAKDPKVTVAANSEACYVFVKVDESATLKTYIEYAIASGWNQLKDAQDNVVTGVYYREVSTEDAKNGVTYTVLGADPNNTNKWVENQVYVKTTVTKSDMQDLNKAGATQPTLTFTAYACQKEGFDTPAAAWEVAKTTPNPTNP